MLKVAIVEDEKEYSDLLLEYLNRFSEETGEKFKTEVFADGLTFLDYYEENKQSFHIVLMDIQMPHFDGLGTSKKWREMDKQASLIFVTNLAKYAIHGYEVEAMDFIVKPIDYFNFTIKFERAVQVQKNKIGKKITLKTDKQGIACLNINEILYVESDLHFLLYHTEKETFRVRGSLKKIEETFGKHNFVRTSNSFLVNLHHVDRIYKDTVSIAGREIGISRSCKKSFFASLALFYGGVE